jgi:hypothetical protein
MRRRRPAVILDTEGGRVPRLSLVLGVGVVLVAAPALLQRASAARPSHSAQAIRVERSASPPGLLVVEHPDYHPSSSPRATLISPAGKPLPLPARLRRFPYGLSPDAGMVVGFSGERSTGDLLLGPVRGGSLATLVHGVCSRSRPCDFGPEFSVAWSPDSQRLAVGVNRADGRTLLKLFDRERHLLRSLSLPRHVAMAYGDEVRSYEVVAWSPDGARLLLRQLGEFGQAVAVVDLDSGRLRTLEQLPGPLQSYGVPAPAWSPDGRYVALGSEGAQDSVDLFAVYDAASGRPVLHRTYDKHTGPVGGGRPLVWAADGHGLFVEGKEGGIDRVLLSGRRTQLTTVSGAPRLAFSGGLVYSTWPPRGHELLHLLDFASANARTLMTARTGVVTVLPLGRLPKDRRTSS